MQLFVKGLVENPEVLKLHLCWLFGYFLVYDLLFENLSFLIAFGFLNEIL